MKKVEQALEQIYAYAGASEQDHFVYTSSQAESITQVFHTAYHSYMLETGKNQVLVANLEDAPVMMNSDLYERMGCSVEMIPVASDGKITPEILNLYTSEKSAILFISYSNRLTGVIQPIEEIAAFCQKHGILLHVNVSDAIGKLYFRFEDYPISFLSFDRCLFAKKEIKLIPLIPATSDLNPYRGGGLNVEEFVAYANSLLEIMEDQATIGLRMARLRNLFETHFETVLFGEEMRVPHISCLSFEGMSADLLRYRLNEEGFEVNLGGGEVQTLDHILTRSGLSKVEALSALSFAFSSNMRDEEVESLAVTLQKLVTQLSPLKVASEV